MENQYSVKENEDVRFRDATPISPAIPFVVQAWLCKNILPIREAEMRCYDSEDK
jgi:hypothetical protein